MSAKRFVTTQVEVEGRVETKIVEMPSRSPEPWGDDADLHVVGLRAQRMDALEKVTGQARYTADVQLAGMLHAVVLRSPIARGQVTEIDFTAALALAGVSDVLTLGDVPGIRRDGVQLFDQRIHYAGQPLAAICAESADVAHRALGLVRMTYESEAPVSTPAQALATDAPKVKPNGNTPRNMPKVSKRGDVHAGLAAADVTITREYRTPVALHTAMEPHGAVAEWVGEQVTVYESTQGIFNTRADLAAEFKLPLSHVRVIKNYMGGGFGAKNGASTAAAIAVALSRKLERPVRCIWDREGEQLDAGNRPATIQRVTLGAKRDGTLTAIQLDATIPLGIGGWQGGPGKFYHEMYACENVETRETFVYMNTSAMSSFRAPGHTEGAFGLECALDALAHELHMDPLALRVHNHAARDQVQDRPYSLKRLRECYAQGAEQFGWEAHRASCAKQSSSSRLRRGVGVASQIWSAGGGPPAYATVRINPDGTIEVLTGAQDLGTGARTVFAQVAAETLGAKLGDCRTVLGDTERLPFASNSWGSITTASVAPAVRVAAEEARERLFEAASGMLGVEPDQLESRDSLITVLGEEKSLTFAQVGRKLGDVMIIGQGSRGPNPEKTAISAFAAQFAEVEVDVDTGRVRVLRIVSAHDSGRILNPTLAESQLEGGIIQGVGYALFEERVLDERLGLPMNPTSHDYKVPTIGDVPVIEAFFVAGSDVVANHVGVKGVAEPPIIPTAPAIANAVRCALGVECLEIPLTPWRVLGALQSS
ncbi:MAG: xanthine dehydrogenase family protein molybdopterin-binding subunit [Gemmatimonadetes bacterium]|nr:xanthine dehydrogenase family protein molybdopterin-binding subunit [Gemmatimonadota bacterium]